MRDDLFAGILLDFCSIKSPSYQIENHKLKSKGYDLWCIKHRV